MKLKTQRLPVDWQVSPPVTLPILGIILAPTTDPRDPATLVARGCSLARRRDKKIARPARRMRFFAGLAL